MAKRYNSNVAFWRRIATATGACLVGMDAWLNAEHMIHRGSWSLTTAAVLATVGAAGALPIAERAWAAGHRWHSLALVPFFFLMAGFGFTASLDRVASERLARIEAKQDLNSDRALLQQALDDAREAARVECASGRGPKCRDAEAKATAARQSLADAPPETVADPLAAQISAALPFIKPEMVGVWQPLLLPTALQLGGFLMLGIGLSPIREASRPAKRRKAVKPSTRVVQRKLRLVASND